MNTSVEFFRDMVGRYHQKEQHARKRAIQKFTNEFHQKKEYREYQDSTMLLLSDKGYDGLSEKESQAIIDTYQRVKKDFIYYNCYAISAMIAYTKAADGVTTTSEGADELVGCRNHAINYIVQSDGHIIAFDCTAGVNIDNNQGVFEILAIQADSLHSLKFKLDNLYGGNWQTMSKEEIHDIYKIEYPDTREQQEEAYNNQAKRLQIRYGSSE